MNVFVMNKNAFNATMQNANITNDNIETFSKVCIISINDTTGTDEVSYFENKENVKVMFFDDVEKDLVVGKEETIKLKAFTEKQADEILQFISKHKQKESCIINCSDGSSRSGAVGTFLNDYFNNDWIDFKKKNPYILPNGHVLRLLNCALTKIIKTGNDQQLLK